MTSEHFKGEDLETRVKQLEASLAQLKGDSRLSNLPYGTLKQAASMFSVRRTGRYYFGGIAGSTISYSGGGIGNAIMSAGYLYAVPFYMPGVPNRVSKIGVYAASGAAGANVRLGIYDDIGGPNPVKPHKLLLDAGEADVSAGGNKLLDVMQDFPRGLKWLACISNNSTPLYRVITEGSWAILGDTTMVGSSLGNRWAYNQGYGELPDPFHAGAAISYGNIHIIGVMFE